MEIKIKIVIRIEIVSKIKIKIKIKIEIKIKNSSISLVNLRFVHLLNLLIQKRGLLGGRVNFLFVMRNFIN